MFIPKNRINKTKKTTLIIISNCRHACSYNKSMTIKRNGAATSERMSKLGQKFVSLLASSVVSLFSGYARKGGSTLSHFLLLAAWSCCRLRSLCYCLVRCTLGVSRLQATATVGSAAPCSLSLLHRLSRAE